LLNLTLVWGCGSMEVWEKKPSHTPNLPYFHTE